MCKPRCYISLILILYSQPRVVPAGGATISGQYIPAGYHIGMNPCILHLDQSVFGPDAEEYNPSRWIEGDATNMDRYFFTFGGGARTCIGRNVSGVQVLSDAHCSR